jgi:hypothetical protein
LEVWTFGPLMPRDPAALEEPAEGRGCDGGSEHGGDAGRRETGGVGGLGTPTEVTEILRVEVGVRGYGRAN